MSAVYETKLPNFKMLHRGKVRDIYDVDDQHMLIITSDRLSAFDVILPQAIPGKGEVLTRVANFWFDRTQNILPNQRTSLKVEDVITDEETRNWLGDRVMVVRKLEALPVEAIVRGYIIGSGWKDYQANGSVCGIELPGG